MNDAFDIVSQIVGHRLQQGDLKRLLGTLNTQDHEEFMGRIVTILDKVSALLEISTQAANAQSLDVLLKRLVTTTAEAINAESGSLLLYDRESNDLYSRIAEGTSVQELRFPCDQGIAGAVFRSGVGTIIRDAHADPRFNREVDQQTNDRTRNLLCVPIRTRAQEIVGVAQLLNKRDGDFTAEDIQLLEAMTSQASVVLQNAQLFEQMQRARREEQQFLEMATAISTEVQLSPLLAKVMQTTTAMLDADRSTLFIYDDKTEELWSQVIQGEGISEIRIPATVGIAGTVFTTGETINIPDAYADPRFNPEVDKRTGYTTHSILCMPVVNKSGRVTGVTQVLNKKGGGFTEADERRLKAFSAQASIAIENAQLFDDISNMRNYNENILQSLSNGVITLDVDRRVAKCNDAALKILKADRDQIIGMQAEDYFSVSNRWVVNIVTHVTRTRQPDLIVDTEYYLDNHSLISINLTVLPLTNVQQDLIGSMLVFEDITSEKRIKTTFGRYLSKEVVDELLSSPDGLKMGGEMREVTFLVSDLRGFTSLADRLSPHQVITILNRYLSRMVDIIAKYRGTVDEFQGDGILAFFGAPLTGRDDPERAIACALEMQIALCEINAEQRQQGLDELAMGIGINTGEAIVGNIGSEKRSKYGAVGSAINIAYRIESYTMGGQIVISPSTYERVRSLVQTAGTLEAEFKGVKEPMTIYDVIGLGGAYDLKLPEEVPERWTVLDEPLSITCFPVQGKRVASEAIAGSIVRLTTTRAEVRLATPVELHTNVKIILTPQSNPTLSEVYAKVLPFKPTGDALPQTTAHLGFTSLPDDAKAFLERHRR